MFVLHVLRPGPERNCHHDFYLSLCCLCLDVCFDSRYTLNTFPHLTGARVLTILLFLIPGKFLATFHWAPAARSPSTGRCSTAQVHGSPWREAGERLIFMRHPHEHARMLAALRIQHANVISLTFTPNLHSFLGLNRALSRRLMLPIFVVLSSTHLATGTSCLLDSSLKHPCECFACFVMLFIGM